MDPLDIVNNFCGVYLLKSLNPKYKGRTYIGFTVDPNRRIKQHNRGKQYGGAWKTSQKGPWEMILTIYGFPSELCALRFEWAWQHPKKSRRLKKISIQKKNNETSLDYRIRLLQIMLSLPPWCRLPLTIRWISADAAVDAPPTLSPPAHMAIVYGTILSHNAKAKSEITKKEENCKLDIKIRDLISCQICGSSVAQRDSLSCLNPACESFWHVLCLGDKFLEEEMLYATIKRKESQERHLKHIIPVEGTCPKCKSFVLWGDLIRKKSDRCRSTKE